MCHGSKRVSSPQSRLVWHSVRHTGGIWRRKKSNIRPCTNFRKDVAAPKKVVQESSSAQRGHGPCDNWFIPQSRIPYFKISCAMTKNVVLRRIIFGHEHWKEQKKKKEPKFIWSSRGLNPGPLVHRSCKTSALPLRHSPTIMCIKTVFGHHILNVLGLYLVVRVWC
jgi:hypothetical protein